MKDNGPKHERETVIRFDEESDTAEYTRHRKPSTGAYSNG
jgi:hypothetical protein